MRAIPLAQILQSHMPTEQQRRCSSTNESLRLWCLPYMTDAGDLSYYEPRRACDPPQGAEQEQESPYCTHYWIFPLLPSAPDNNVNY